MLNPLPTHDFHAQHSPFGAFASFTMGRVGQGGGFGLELGGPARQDIYLALARPGEKVMALPFFANTTGDEAKAYTGTSQPRRAGDDRWQTWPADAITRTMGWASDGWTAGDLTFCLYTPFGPVAPIEDVGDGELRRSLCPALVAEITVDNTQSGEGAWAFFGIGDTDPLRMLSDSAGAGLVGIAREGQWGFAALPSPGGVVREVLTWDIESAVAAAVTPGATTPAPNRLANRGGVLLYAPPATRQTYTLVLGFYRGGVVTTGIAATYLYSRLFADLETVLSFAAENADYYRQTALARDRELDAAPLSDDRKFLLAHATHSYHGSTMLLHDEKNALPHAPFHSSMSIHRPLWAVNEGEYRMLNTLDLTVDQAVWEIRFHPWTVKNNLDLFVGRYAYRDPTQDATDPARPRFDGGLSFTHDMGVANQFTPPGYSSYEQGNQSGCFGYMTQEQLCNWCLTAALYGLPTRLSQEHKGDLLWLASRRGILRECLQSLVNRDGAEGERNGVMSLDAARCEVGQEITTYDSLDPSLGQARNNLYLAVKTWATYLALSRCFDKLGEVILAAEAEEQAARAAATIAGHWREDDGYFPAVWEEDSPGFHSRIIPAIEGLAYPALWGDGDAVSPYGPYGEMVTRLRRHLKTVLMPGVCIDAKTRGFKLSSSSDNTWLSKVFLSQWVAEHVLGIPLTPDHDAVHAGWQRDCACRDFAFTDQVRSTDGADLGSRYYPRGVTAVLWLGE